MTATVLHFHRPRAPRRVVHPCPVTGGHPLGSHPVLVTDDAHRSEWICPKCLEWVESFLLGLKLAEKEAGARRTIQEWMAAGASAC